MKPLRNFILLISTVFLFSCEMKVTPLTSLVRDQVAAGLVKKQQTELALDQYLKILETSPEEPAVHSNIGVILNQLQKPEEALKSYQLALDLAMQKKDLVAQFSIHFNLGTYYGVLKKYTEALENYQAALEIVPNSKETKTNIELLIQNQQNKSGQGDGKDQKDKDDQQKKDGKDQENKDNKKDGDKDKPDQEKDGKEKDQKPKEHDQGSQKYKPRPYKGDQLSEGDVKKILGELRNQEQKIRANFDKKERKESKNEKDW